MASGGKKMSNIVCVWCHPEIENSSQEGLCPTHEKVFMESLAAEGFEELVEPKKMITKTGKCFLCNIDCTAKSFCYGCGEFVCKICIDTEDLVAGNHTSFAHVKAARKSGTN